MRINGTLAHWREEETTDDGVRFLGDDTFPEVKRAVDDRDQDTASIILAAVDVALSRCMALRTLTAMVDVPSPLPWYSRIVLSRSRPQ